MYEGTCVHCGATVRQQADKAIGTGEWLYCWTDTYTGSWVCPVTGDEHEPR